ncbi:MAG: hypothetical protein ACPIOQ_21530, partial [Promethearchaeia archaeon]
MLGDVLGDARVTAASGERGSERGGALRGAAAPVTEKRRRRLHGHDWCVAAFGSAVERLVHICAQARPGAHGTRAIARCAKRAYLRGTHNPRAKRDGY